MTGSWFGARKALLLGAMMVAGCSRPERLEVVDTLTVSRPSVVGVDSRLGGTLDSIANGAIARGVASGISIGVGRHGRIVHLRGYGTTDWAPGADSVTDSTLFDIASLTKVVATTMAAMILEEEGRLDLDRPVPAYLPELKSKEKATITSRMLLTHSAGFRAGAPLYTKWRGRAEYLEQINKLPLEYEPDSGHTYSEGCLHVGSWTIEPSHRV